MRSIALSLTMTLTLLAFTLTACSKEEAPAPAAKTKPAAIQAAEQAAALAEINNGQKVYTSSCASCHDTGVMGAPKFGDKTAWSGHMHDGLEHMVKRAINGVGKMPPKGGNMRLSDAEVKSAVEYIVEQSK